MFLTIFWKNWHGIHSSDDITTGTENIPHEEDQQCLAQGKLRELDLLKTTYYTEGFAQEIVGLGCSLVAGGVHCCNFLNKDSKLKGKREKNQAFLGHQKLSYK